MKNYIENPSEVAHLLRTCGVAIMSYTELEKVVNEKAKFLMSHNIIGCKSEVMKLIAKVTDDIGVNPKSKGINLQKPVKHIAPDILKLGHSVIRYRNTVSELIAEELFTTNPELSKADKIILSFPEIIKDNPKVSKLRRKVFFALKEHAGKMLKIKSDMDNLNLSTQRCIDKYCKSVNEELLLLALDRV
jgi:hypothetical protein